MHVHDTCYGYAHWHIGWIVGSESFRERVRKGERPKVEPWVTLLPHSFSLSLSLSFSLSRLVSRGETAGIRHARTLAPCERSHNTSKSNPFNRVQHYVAKRSPTARWEKGEEKKKRKLEGTGWDRFLTPFIMLARSPENSSLYTNPLLFFFLFGVCIHDRNIMYGLKVIDKSNFIKSIVKLKIEEDSSVYAICIILINHGYDHKVN